MKNENVLFIERKILESAVDLSQEIIPMSESLLNSLSYGFVPRAAAETDATKKQLIPYVLLLDSEGRVLVYRRNGSEKRLSQKFSAGIGGHVNDGDDSGNLLDTLLKGACREIQEEICLTVLPKQLKMIGMINEEVTEVGHSHTGVVFSLDVDGKCMNFDKEIAEPEWLNPKDVPFENAELWTALAIKLLNEAR